MIWTAIGVAQVMLVGPWRPAPLVVDDNLLFSAKYVCRNPADPDLVAARADLPIVLADARAGGLASLIFADDTVAFECRVKIEMIGDGLGRSVGGSSSRRRRSCRP